MYCLCYVAIFVQRCGLIKTTDASFSLFNACYRLYLMSNKTAFLILDFDVEEGALISNLDSFLGVLGILGLP